MTLPCEDDPDLFFGSVAERRVAIALCATCPLNLKCFEVAIAHGERWGVWGGIDFTRDQAAADADMFPKRKPGRPRKVPA